MSFIFNPAKPGLRKVFREWQELALRCVWENGEKGGGSRAVRAYVLERLTERANISRASVIGFLENLRKQGFLRNRYESSRGGYRRIYHPLLNENDFMKHIVKNMAQSMMRDFPEETAEALNEL